MEIVLASTSIYRQEILKRLRLAFEVAAPICDETPLADESALATSARLARSKAMSLKDQFPNALIIGSDQVALLDGEQLGKPLTLENGIAMLKNMSGKSIRFYTALAIYNTATDTCQEDVNFTTVKMRRLSDAQIRAYLAAEPDALYCAGSAKSEGLGGALIESIESKDPNGLIGLPLFMLVSMLQTEGINVLS